MKPTLTILARSLVAVAIVAALGAGVSACKKPDAKKQEQAPRAVRFARVSDIQLTGGLSATGLLASREEAAVGSELSGYRVAKVLVDINDWVDKGQPIVILDDTLIRAQVAEAQANVAQQKAAAAQAEDQAKRVADLDNQGVLSQEAISQRRFAAQSARAVVNATAAALNDLRTRQERLVIRAPVSGLVMERNIRPGDISSPATIMFRIIRDDLVEVDAQVPEGALSNIKVGSQVQAILPDGSKVFGKVRYISPAVDPLTKLGHVRVALPVRRDLRPGGYARAMFTGLNRVEAAVPDSAIRYNTSGPTVMTLDAQSRAHEVDIRTGEHSKGWVELLQGPPVGSPVLLGGSVFVLEGDKVAAQPDGAAQPPIATTAGKAPR